MTSESSGPGSADSSGLLRSRRAAAAGLGLAIVGFSPVALAQITPPPASPPASPPPSEPVIVHEANVRPPPIHVEYAQWGVALTANVNVSPGPACGPNVAPPGPCIIGSGGGLAVRGGYRNPGPWYIGGAYEFTKMDSQNLYRLGIFQQFRFELRYYADLGARTTPFVTGGAGGVAYGNEWSAETGGGELFAGGGVEIEVSRLAVVGVSMVYRPALIAGWVDTAGLTRPTGLSQFLGIEFRLEVRTELGRR